MTTGQSTIDVLLAAIAGLATLFASGVGLRALLNSRSERGQTIANTTGTLVSTAMTQLAQARRDEEEARAEMIDTRNQMREQITELTARLERAERVARDAATSARKAIQRQRAICQEATEVLRAHVLVLQDEVIRLGGSPPPMPTPRIIHNHREEP